MPSHIRVIGPIIVSILIFVFNLASAAIPNRNQPSTLLGPTFAVSTISTLDNLSAYNIGAEVAPRNYRVGGTLAWQIACQQRFKFSAEYLWQKIQFPFFSENNDYWVNQGAIGADYQYDLAELAFLLRPQLNLNFYYSHAKDKNLNQLHSRYIDGAGGRILFVEERHIAGSNAVGLSPGVAINPWCGGKIRADINYDRVRYHRNNAPNEDAVGFGGTLSLNQLIMKDVELDLTASLRQPFNYYQASLAFINLPYLGMWSVSVDASYTAGKHTLTNTYNIGVSVNYFQDLICTDLPHIDYICENNRNSSSQLLSFTAKPAIHMPEVLAITDNRRSS